MHESIKRKAVRVFALKGLKPGSTSRVPMRYRICLTRIVAAGGNAGAIQRLEWRIELAGLISCAGDAGGRLERLRRKDHIEMIFICQDLRARQASEIRGYGVMSNITELRFS